MSALQLRSIFDRSLPLFLFLLKMVCGWVTWVRRLWVNPNFCKDQIEQTAVFSSFSDLIISYK